LESVYRQPHSVVRVLIGCQITQPMCRAEYHAIAHADKARKFSHITYSQILTDSQWLKLNEVIQ